MVWGDIVDCSSNCPEQSASFLTQCKIKKEAVSISQGGRPGEGLAFVGTTAFIFPAKAP